MSRLYENRDCLHCGTSYSPRAYNQKWCEPCAPSIHTERKRLNSRVYYRNKTYTPESRHAESLKKVGITSERYAELLERQGGVCAICRQPPRGHRHNWLVVDHDHSCCPGKRSCGKCIRGLLCMSCNKGIGLLGDDPYRVQAAAEYLNKHQVREATSV